MFRTMQLPDCHDVLALKVENVCIVGLENDPLYAIYVQPYPICTSYFSPSRFLCFLALVVGTSAFRGAETLIRQMVKYCFVFVQSVSISMLPYYNTNYFDPTHNSYYNYLITLTLFSFFIFSIQSIHNFSRNILFSTKIIK